MTNVFEAQDAAAANAEKFVPEEGQNALVNGLPARIERYAVEANLSTFVYGVGQSIDRVTAHISNTTFAPIGDYDTSSLDVAVDGAQWVADPQPEPADTTRVTDNGTSGDEITTADSFNG